MAGPVLSVNLNAVALLRNRRDLSWPSVAGMGRLVLEAGAAGLTVHPRADERHIRSGDVADLKGLLREEFPDREYNIEGYPDDRWLALVEAARPNQATLVPDDPWQTTSDHGWPVAEKLPFLRPIIERLKGGGTRVALFVDADPDIAEAAAEAGADRIEMYTGPYGDLGAADGDRARRQVALDALARTARRAKDVGLGVNAGHDLTLENLPAFVSAVPAVAEVSIGHGITADALRFGFPEAVRLYTAALSGELEHDIRRA